METLELDLETVEVVHAAPVEILLGLVAQVKAAL
jgi:hypothetical protein